MADYDLVIKDGMVFDGTRNPRVRADVAVKAGRVAEMGRIPASSGDRVLDASGLHVAPGFVDLHTHYDAQVFWDPYCSLSGWHGVTSVAIGNCGFGFAPVEPEQREDAMRSMTRVEAIPYESMRLGLPWDWVSFPEFLDSLQRTPKALNVLPYVPVGPMLVKVLGREAAKAGALPTDEQHGELARLLDEAMEAGGCGWSAQRLPPSGTAAVQRDWDGTAMPTDVMHDETARVLAEVLGRRNEGVVQMILTSGNVAHDLAHIEDLATISGRPLLYNVVQVYEERPHIHRNQLAWLERCRRRGIPVYGQGVTTDAGFTFTFEDWNLYDDSEAWCEATTGTFEERLAKLSDPARRQALKDNLPRAASAALRTVTVLTPKSPETEPYRQMSAAQAGEAMGKHFVDALLDIAVADRLQTVFYTAPPQGDSRPARRDRAGPLHPARGVRRRGPHQVPHRRALPDRDAGGPRAGKGIPLPGGRPLAPLGAAGVAGRFPRPGHHQGGRPGRHRRLRLRAPRVAARRGQLRSARRGVAADPTGPWLPLGAGQWGDHHRRRQGDRRPPGSAPSSRRLKATTRRRQR